MNDAKVVLVTGAGSGIGRATVEHLAARGMRVFASARRDDAVEALREAGRTRGFDAVSLDVTDDASVDAAVHDVLTRAGRIDALVNNAGYGLLAPMESVTPEALRAQLETNVIGAHRVARAVLPSMRAARRGTIVQISSVAGRVALPLYGAYAASKFALEAMSDAMRVELAPLGVRVVLIEPGPIRTGFSATAEALSIACHDDPRGRPYADLIDRMMSARERTRETAGLGPEHVARAIERALVASHPSARSPITTVARALPLAQTLLPQRAFDALVRRVVGGRAKPR